MGRQEWLGAAAGVSGADSPNCRPHQPLPEVTTEGADAVNCRVDFLSAQRKAAAHALVSGLLKFRVETYFETLLWETYHAVNCRVDFLRAQLRAAAHAPVSDLLRACFRLLEILLGNPPTAPSTLPRETF